jgi:hypothetical protein
VITTVAAGFPRLLGIERRLHSRELRQAREPRHYSIIPYFSLTLNFIYHPLTPMLETPDIEGTIARMQLFDPLRGANNRCRWFHLL